MFDELPGQGELHLWLLHLDFERPLPDTLTSLLHPAEADRANRFHFAADRYRYRACRSMLRLAIANYLRVHPASVKFGTGEHGKPFLTQPSGAHLSFNVSHSGNLGAMLFSAADAVGVDVERMRPEVDVLELARACLSEIEIQHLRSAGASDRMAVFFRYWTGKEAWIKADGRGLSLPLQSHTLTPVDAARYCVSPQHSKPWTILPFDTPPGYAGAVAAPGDWTVRRVDLNPAEVTVPIFDHLPAAR